MTENNKNRPPKGPVPTITQLSPCDRQIIELAYELGRDAVLQARYEAADDMWCAIGLPEPRRSYEERVADRITEMEICAAMVKAQILAEASGQPRRPWGRCS